MKLRFDVVKPDIAGLARDFRVNPASCDNPEFYEDYLKWISYSDWKSGENTTHILLDEETNEIMGFIALRATSIISEESNIKGTPALEISVLAVNQKYEGLGFGRDLIDYAVYTATYLHEQLIGVRDIVLTADHKAVGFYKKLGFVPIQDYVKIPTERWSKNCEPMILRLNFGLEPSFVTEDDDEEDDT